jgi:hypothetical protein
MYVKNDPQIPLDPRPRRNIFGRISPNEHQFVARARAQENCGPNGTIIHAITLSFHHH